MPMVIMRSETKPELFTLRVIVIRIPLLLIYLIEFSLFTPKLEDVSQRLRNLAVGCVEGKMTRSRYSDTFHFSFSIRLANNKISW